jgi:hypothetical protein
MGLTTRFAKHDLERRSARLPGRIWASFRDALHRDSTDMHIEFFCRHASVMNAALESWLTSAGWLDIRRFERDVEGAEAPLRQA